jgi:hypothetical protein
MNSARARGPHRIRQATAVLAGVGVLATGAVAGLAHASDTTSASTSATTTSAASSAGSATSVQLGVAGAAPQAQTGGS